MRLGTSRYPWRYPQPPNWQLWQLDQTNDDSVKARLHPVLCAATQFRSYSAAGNWPNVSQSFDAVGCFCPMLTVDVLIVRKWPVALCCGAG